ncbi:Sugar (pentulose or hexulose) kinase [Micromonospora pattaloongensis]|uniref:Sugar (Pentulose or hexulose) kinase n=1 Tax=Micromonospora pattaloongensis TaxID=405436 RepID=A0A1H3SYF4_9ACTN|nr:FGGY family carbohydrate kinase [Micromonospora pattaloongensis]SDZ42601.1 Sugar (pentulose or hexulose) kinase [Micromonospora pattaloongensis]
MIPLLVGLDVGTTSSKAVVFTAAGQPVAQGRSVTPWTTTAQGAEMDPNAVLDSAREALALALADAPEGAVAAVGVTSMGESGVLLDGRGAPLGPVIAWHDTRDGAEVDDLKAAIGDDRFARHTGLPLRGQWSLTKHRWLLAHHPQLRAATRRLNIAEWVVRGLGGEEGAEQSLASRTGWLELSSRGWWPEALEWSGASASLMPELVTAGTPLGRVTAEAGLPRLTGAVLTVAGHDHQAATVGVGAAGPGDELDSCGTAEALIRTVPIGLDGDAVAKLAGAGITTGWHVLADRWCLLGGTQGGLALQRILALLGRTSRELPDLDRDALARNTPPLRVDGVDDEALTVSGIGSGLTPADLWRAALEAVTAQAGSVHSAMSAVVGDHQSLVVTGGWARSHALLEVKRRVLGPLRHSSVDEGGARGAALFAAMAAGLYATPAEFPVVD